MKTQNLDIHKFQKVNSWPRNLSSEKEKKNKMKLRKKYKNMMI